MWHLGLGGVAAGHLQGVGGSVVHTGVLLGLLAHPEFADELPGRAELGQAPLSVDAVKMEGWGDCENVV